MVNDDYERHGDLRRALPERTARPLFFKRQGRSASFREGFPAELASPLSRPCPTSFSHVLSRVDWPRKTA
jgi:hypothetical protein